MQEMEHVLQRMRDLHGRHQHPVGLTAQLRMVKTEKSYADQFLASLENNTVECKANISRFKTSNIPAQEQLWNIVGRYTHLTFLGQSVVINPKKHTGKKERTGKKKKTAGLEQSPDVVRGGKGVRDKGLRNKDGEDMVHVHAAVEGGAEWLKLFTMTEKRLLLEMADAGWDWGAEDDETVDEQDEAELIQHLETLRTAKHLVTAARNAWHKYKHPRVSFIFTRIREGHDIEIDKLLQTLRRLAGDDITVNLHFADSELVLNQPPITFDTTIHNMCSQPDYITDTVLLDTSVLISLASDITHTAIQHHEWRSSDARAQVTAEQDGRHFFKIVYPRICGRKLICTKEAVRQFLKIIDTIGSPDEVARASQLLEGCREDFQKLSIHPVPDNLLLPVEVIRKDDPTPSAESLVTKGILPPVAIEVGRHLQDDQVTHLYGWTMGLTVVTGNRILTNTIVRVVEESLLRDYEEGPRIYPLSANRALGTKGPSPKALGKLQRNLARKLAIQQR